MVDAGGGDAVDGVLWQSGGPRRSGEDCTQGGRIATKAMDGAAGSAVEGSEPAEEAGANLTAGATTKA